MKGSALLLSAMMGAALCAGDTNLFNDPAVKKPEGDPWHQEWFLATSTREVFELNRDETSDSVYLASTGADYSGYLVQIVPVKPNTRYRFEVDIRHLNGRALLWVKAYDKARKPLHYDERKYLISSADCPLVPDFVSVSMLQGSGSTDWRTVSLEFDTVKRSNDTEEIAYVRVGAGPYFSVAKMYLRNFRLYELGPAGGKK